MDQKFENLLREHLEKSQDKFTFFKGFGKDLEAQFPGGSWRTINGAKVFIHNGKVVAGLDNFNGKIDDFFKEKKEKVNDLQIKPDDIRGTFVSIDGDTFDSYKDFATYLADKYSNKYYSGLSQKRMFNTYYSDIMRKINTPDQFNTEYQYLINQMTYGSFYDERAKLNMKIEKMPDQLRNKIKGI